MWAGDGDEDEDEDDSRWCCRFPMPWTSQPILLMDSLSVPASSPSSDQLGLLFCCPSSATQNIFSSNKFWLVSIYTRIEIG